MVLSVVVFIAYSTNVVSLVRNGDVESIRSTMDGSIIYKLLFSLIAMVIQNTFTIIPLILLISINVALFGFFYGFIWSWLSSIIAAIIVFITVRYFFQGWLIHKVSPKLLAKAKKKGFLYVFEARIFPFVPTSLVNIVSGLSPIQLKFFIFGTLIGNFIYFFALSLIPLGLLSLNIDKHVIGIIIVLSVLSFFVYKVIHHRKNRVEASYDNLKKKEMEEKV
ncbi:TVP38/TMEM64 family protein [Alkalihalobacterium alkalinitrilicum]|uniref:TVP38/TMEM64 family protein n=1 Tax=Alkalihalobacterium alkalinitrilicum TaxID=427920 RepID=UPI000995D472|nr:VTT domain-containing protein [Alkalihalobacterium alkalinitrilicum]